jgi:tight adherence protein B
VSALPFELLTALAVAGAVGLGFVWYRGRHGEPLAAQRMRLLVDEPDDAPKRGISWNDLRRRGPSSLPLMREFLLQTAWAQRLRLEIEQAGLRLHVGEYIIARVAIGLVVFALVWALGRSGPTLVLALACGAGGFMAPALWLNSERNRRREHIGKQLPEAAQMIANSLRAGFSFQHGCAIVADQMEPPIADEFARVNVDLNVGSTIEEALYALLARTDTAEMNLVVTAVLVQRTAGGNLAEILEMVADQIRERERLTGEVKTMTSQQRFSGLVLAIWPLLLLAAFCLLNWEQTSLLFTTSAGLALLALGAVLQILGFVTIRRILSVEI